MFTSLSLLNFFLDYYVELTSGALALGLALAHALGLWCVCGSARAWLVALLPCKVLFAHRMTSGRRRCHWVWNPNLTNYSSLPKCVSVPPEPLHNDDLILEMFEASAVQMLFV